MEYRSISAKLPVNELTMFKAFCEKKGVTPAALIRDMILREMKITIPHRVAGRNVISYEKKDDSYTWSVSLDGGEKIEVLKRVSPEFIFDLLEQLKLSNEERNSFIKKKNQDSVTIPNLFLGKDKK